MTGPLSQTHSDRFPGIAQRGLAVTPDLRALARGVERLLHDPVLVFHGQGELTKLVIAIELSDDGLSETCTVENRPRSRSSGSGGVKNGRSALCGVLDPV